MHVITDVLSLKNWQFWDAIYPQEFPIEVCFEEKDIRRLYGSLIYGSAGVLVGIIIAKIFYEVIAIEHPKNHTDDDRTYCFNNTSTLNVWLRLP